MHSLHTPPVTDHPAGPPFPLSDEFPFAQWSDLGDRPQLHPVLRQLWEQVKRGYWYRGHPASGALFEAVYEMSLKPSFRGVGRCCLLYTSPSPRDS